MTALLFIMFAVIWVNVGLIAARAENALDGLIPLDTVSVPVRLIMILIAPVTYLIFDRHIFYKKKVTLCESTEP